MRPPPRCMAISRTHRNSLITSTLLYFTFAITQALASLAPAIFLRRRSQWRRAPQALDPPKRCKNRCRDAVCVDTRISHFTIALLHLCTKTKTRCRGAEIGAEMREIAVTDLIPVPCCLRRVFAFAMFDMLVCKLSGWAITRLPVDSTEHRRFEF